MWNSYILHNNNLIIAAYWSAAWNSLKWDLVKCHKFRAVASHLSEDSYFFWGTSFRMGRIPFGV